MPRDVRADVLAEVRDPAELDIAEALKGLDALDTPTVVTTPWWRRALAVGLPPLVALVLFIAVWQLIWASAITSEYKVPAPISVWDEFAATVDDGRVWSILWTSISRAFVGFAIALVSPRAPSTCPTLGRIGGIWSIPATRPFAIDGIEPASTTK